MSDSLFELVPGGTDRAVGIAVDPDPCPFHCQCIEQKQGTCQRRADTSGEFQGFGCLHGADNPDQRCENANLRGFQILEMLVFRKQAGVTGGIITPWIVNRDLPVELDDGTGYKWNASGHAGAIDNQACFEIVGAIKNDIRSPDEFGQRRFIHPIGYGNNIDRRVNAGQCLFS